MKKYLLLLVILPMCIWAQTNKATRFEFMGIPIYGSLDEFANKLSEKGFVITEHKKTLTGFNQVCLSGNFWRFDKAEIIVSDTQNSNKKEVERVTVTSECDRLQLDDLKKSLSNKYGAPKGYTKYGVAEYVWLVLNGEIKLFHTGNSLSLTYKNSHIIRDLIKADEDL